MIDPVSDSVDRFAANLDALKHRMQTGFDRIDERFDQMFEALASLREHMDRRFDAMERRHDDRMRVLEDVLTDHSGRIRRLEQSSPRQA